MTTAQPPPITNSRARELLAQGYAQIEHNDLVNASESLRDAAIQAIAEVARNRGWQPPTDARAAMHVVNRIDIERGIGIQLTRLFISADLLDVNVDDDGFQTDMVEWHADRIRSLIRRLETLQ